MPLLETFGHRPWYDEPGDFAGRPSPVHHGRWTRRGALGAMLWTVGVVIGCGQSTGPQITEEQKSKQQVVQDKMKEYMKSKTQKGPRRGP
jgi:hypothetical protein